MRLGRIVCKRKNLPYRVTEKPSPYWIEVKNPRYSQAEGSGGIVRVTLAGFASYFGGSGFQLRISVMGEAVDASEAWLIRKRPSRETAY
jgi:hypothetical protein